MVKNKLVAIAMTGMLAACVGLSACAGNNAASSSAASESAASSEAAASSAEAASTTEASAEAASSAATAASTSTTASKVLYWEGELSNGSTVSYYNDETADESALSVVSSDLSDAAVWMGTSRTGTDGKVTVTDAETKSTISFTIVEQSADTMKINLEGYGEVELKATTEADYQAFVAEIAAVAAAAKRLVQDIETGGKNIKKAIKVQARKLANEIASLDESTVFFWTGKLADSSEVSYMEDPENSEASLSIVEANLSDSVLWYGKYATDQSGKKVTITDEESGGTISYDILESTPGTSLKIDIEGYGEVTLKPVTKGDFTKLAEELTKVANASANANADASAAAK